MRTVLAPNAPWPATSEPSVGIQQRVATFIQAYPGPTVAEIRIGARAEINQANAALSKLRSKLTLVRDPVKPEGARHYPIRYYWKDALP